MDARPCRDVVDWEVVVVDIQVGWLDVEEDVVVVEEEIWSMTILVLDVVVVVEESIVCHHLPRCQWVPMVLPFNISHSISISYHRRHSLEYTHFHIGLRFRPQGLLL
jgi:hypothetical protein